MSAPAAATRDPRTGLRRFYGKYRGKVELNVDPLQLGRVQVSCPAVLGSGRLAWAMPCTPFAGAGVGFFAVPPIGANAWIEFEGGDPDHPIVAGGFWGIGEVPALPAVEQMTVLKRLGVSITLNTLPGAGGIVIEAGPPVTPLPMAVRLGATGIELTHGAAKVALTPASVSVNNGALEVI